MAWSWDARVGQYRDKKTGRFLPYSYVRQWAQESIDSFANSERLDFLATQVYNKILSPADFNTFFREEIKREYIRQFLVGIGGEDRMTSEYWGSIGGSLAEQYKWLDKFIEEIAAGTVSYDFLIQRMRMYVHSAREAYERAQNFLAKKLGKAESLWVLGVAEHCGDCLDFSDEGWQPIEHFPMPASGKTECLTNCMCHLEYR